MGDCTLMIIEERKFGGPVGILLHRNCECTLLWLDASVMSSSLKIFLEDQRDVLESNSAPYRYESEAAWP